VVAEVALSAVLLVASGLLVRTIVNMQHADIGIEPAGLMGISVTMRSPQWKTPELRRSAMESMLDQVRGIPGVRAATISMAMPPQFATAMGALEIEGRSISANDSLTSVAFTSARPDYFALTGTRLIRGHVFADDPTVGDRVLATEVIVNETFARRFWPNGEALGGKVRTGSGPWLTIVGVAADVILPTSKRAWSKTQFYRAMPAAPLGATILVRSNIPLATLLPSLEAAIKRASPNIRVGRSSSAEAALVESRATHRFTLALVGGFAAVALLLAALGLHAVVAFSVGQRTREIGVRVALGAQKSDIMRLVVGQGTGLALVGVVIGAAGGIAAAQTMRALLYGTRAADPATLAAVSLVLGVVAVVASYVPARRAMRVDPVEALRSE
jgi:predicted permease